jgi:mitochondrial GTPase 1
MNSRITALLPHMRDALANIAKRLSQTDVVVELRDARLPFTSENYFISDLIAKKRKRLLLLSKADLANPMFRKVIPHLRRFAPRASA